MKYIGTVVAATVACLTASSAFAAQNVANTNQKGSLLIWPLVTVQPRGQDGPRDTLIEISNDGNKTVHVECMYVNERKGRVNFDFDLTAKQTASWDVLTLAGDQVHPPRFPGNAGNPSFPGSTNRGILICFATAISREYQIAWNQLTGTGTVLKLNDDKAAAQPHQAYRYNAWAFAARDEYGLAPDDQWKAHGEPGYLNLSGEDYAGHYDGCPAYNIANFMPNGATLGNLSALDNEFSFAGCNQDLRETYAIHATKLEFTVWNSEEHSFTGAHACVDSLGTVNLRQSRRLTAGSNFDFSVLQTPNARFQVRGVGASPPCTFPTEASGLLGLVASSAGIGGLQDDLELGETTHGAGVTPGYVKWDVSHPVPPKH